ncbi:GGDEF domain-containing protein [Vibrio algarum]|uniref:diguanylate cyclase n=1 Tax=Vibrio algarum TaxID=3020714 RepID=A0ABT4YTA3_9VIBR|nr:GGDEF domain-containing protein [Vibrio sp. KJ40-1]MDB1124789.1 GGDEF domain-containing protein [Vibrio sp. KJ40-1]
MLFISHLGLVVSIILGMSFSRYHNEWNVKVENMAGLSASHLSSYATFLSVSVAGRNYANLLMRSTTDNLKAIPNLMFAEISGVSDYSSHNVQVRYLVDINKAWRLDVTSTDIEDLEKQLVVLEEKLSSTATSEKIRLKKLNYLVNKAKVELIGLRESLELQSLTIPERPPNIERDKYFLDEDNELLHILVDLRNKNKGGVWAVIDASQLTTIRNNLLFDVVKEAILALLISTMLIYIVTLWLVSPLKNLSVLMKEDVEKIDQSQISELRRQDEIGDLARSYSSLITRIKNQLRVLHNQTETDPLTGLGSRYKYQNQAALMMQSALQNGDFVYFVLCDIDNFKPFNDTYGHTVGDNALTAVANSMNDIILPHELGCRLGGEEFVFILSGDDETLLNKRVRDINQSVAVLNIPHINNPPYDIVTISIGAVPIVAMKDSISFEEVQRLLDTSFVKSDKQLYAAKDKGRNLVLFDEAIAINDEDLSLFHHKKAPSDMSQ